MRPAHSRMDEGSTSGTSTPTACSAKDARTLLMLGTARETGRPSSQDSALSGGDVASTFLAELAAGGWSAEHLPCLAPAVGDAGGYIDHRTGLRHMPSSHSQQNVASTVPMGHPLSSMTSPSPQATAISCPSVALLAQTQASAAVLVSTPMPTICDGAVAVAPAAAASCGEAPVATGLPLVNCVPPAPNGAYAPYMPPGYPYAIPMMPMGGMTPMAHYVPGTPHYVPIYPYPMVPGLPMPATGMPILQMGGMAPMAHAGGIPPCMAA